MSPALHRPLRGAAQGSTGSAREAPSRTPAALRRSRRITFILYLRHSTPIHSPTPPASITICSQPAGGVDPRRSLGGAHSSCTPAALRRSRRVTFILYLRHSTPIYISTPPAMLRSGFEDAKQAWFGEHNGKRLIRSLFIRVSWRWVRENKKRAPSPLPLHGGSRTLARRAGVGTRVLYNRCQPPFTFLTPPAVLKSGFEDAKQAWFREHNGKRLIRSLFIRVSWRWVRENKKRAFRRASSNPEKKIWRRGESNPLPKAVSGNPLRA